MTFIHFSRHAVVLGVFAVVVWAFGLLLSHSMEAAWYLVLGLGVGLFSVGLGGILGSRHDRSEV